jgi:3-phenylpropionate/trans-cinnamate dioxygenase ferredoxin subunit
VGDLYDTLHSQHRSALNNGARLRRKFVALEIVAKPNGPYAISGDLSLLRLQDGAGNLYNLEGKKRIFLCRCGASVTKPFCDGQHTKIGFQAAEQAVALQEG